MPKSRFLALLICILLALTNPLAAADTALPGLRLTYTQSPLADGTETMEDAAMQPELAQLLSDPDSDGRPDSPELTLPAAPSIPDPVIPDPVIPNPLAPNPITVTLGGQRLDFPTPPLLQDGRVLVPFRPVFEALGYKITYDPADDAITATGPAGEITLWPGYRITRVGGTWRRLAAPVVVRDGYAMVPLRGVSETAGAVVAWDEATQAVTITPGGGAPTPATGLPVVQAGNSRRIAYLTFDDGPYAPVTREVLAVLDTFGVKATFFVIGKNAAGSPELLRRMRAVGHSVGNHSYSHDYAEIYQSPTTLLASLQAAEEVLLPRLGYRPRLIRAPGGSYGHLTPEMEEALKAAGYRWVDWNVTGGDATNPRLSAREIAANVRTTLAGRSRAIILLHDGATHAATAAALPRIIDFLLMEGYTLAALPDA